MKPFVVMPLIVPFSFTVVLPDARARTREIYGSKVHVAHYRQGDHY